MTTIDEDNEQPTSPTAAPPQAESATTLDNSDRGTTQQQDAVNEKQTDSSNTSLPPPRPAVSRPARKSAWLAWTLLIVLVAALGAGGYFAWPLLQDYQQRFQTLEDNNQRQQNQLANTSAQLQQLQQTVAEQQQALSTAEDSEQALRAQLSAQNESIRSLTATTTDDWKLAEAYYLTRLASQRIAMERNTQGALTLLQAADEIINRHLQNHVDPALTTVRQQLAQDIVALKVAGTVDREGMFFTINAVMDQINQLPQAQPLNYREQRDTTDAENAAAVTDTTDGEDGIWQRVRRSFGDALTTSKDFIRVSHPDEPLTALPASNQQQLLMYRAQALLLSSQLALLREQPRIFANSLQQVEQLLAASYPLTDNPAFQQVKGIVATLQSLQAQTIVQQLPDISQSQQQLGDYLDRLHRIGSNAPAPTEPTEPQSPEAQSSPTSPQEAPP